MTGRNQSDGQSETAVGAADGEGNPGERTWVDPPDAAAEGLAVGVDAVAVDRIERAIARTGEPFLERVFTDAEVAYCRSQARPAEHFAARWAAKEAAVKALPDGDARVALDDVAVERPVADGRPRLSLSGGALAAARVFAARGDDDLPATTLSLSHDGDSGVATAVVALAADGSAEGRALTDAVAVGRADVDVPAGNEQSADASQP